MHDRFWHNSSTWTPSNIERHVGHPRRSSTPKSETRSPANEATQKPHFIFELSTTPIIGKTFVLRDGPAPRTQGRQYIGVRTREEAEKMVQLLATFRFYHQLPDDGWPVEDALKLHVCYRAEDGKYSHLRILKQQCVDGGVTREMFYVESRRFNQPNISFPNIDQLIKYYSTYVHLRKSSQTNKVEVEVFDTTPSQSFEDLLEEMAENRKD
ncbi:unnamed protein product, partial [Mesorhabditis belari]|uniref:Uncharacterized protein n=1 Tax=Mesorhabditis belari TaxID=2138241 RepID=A0AAF3F1J7_9BILA